MIDTYVTPKSAYFSLQSRYASTARHHWLQNNTAEMGSEPKLVYMDT
jgi:hypothetical protein